METNFENLNLYYYIYNYLPSENHDMLHGPRIVAARNDNHRHTIDIAEGPFKNLKDLKVNSKIWKELIIKDRKRAEKIIQKNFIVPGDKLIRFPEGLNEEYEKIIYRIMQHSSNGKISGENVSGLHLYDSKKMRILNLIDEENEFGVFKAEIEALNLRTGKWIKKETETTFFPNDWDLQKLIDECYFAFLNKQKENNNEYTGRTKCGIKVSFIYSDAGEFQTVFPIFE